MIKKLCTQKANGGADEGCGIVRLEYNYLGRRNSYVTGLDVTHLQRAHKRKGKLKDKYGRR